MKLTKKLILSLTAFSMTGLLWAATFSGSTGIQGNIITDKECNTFEPIMTMKGFFAGQLDITPNFLVRTELSVQTADVLDTKLIEDTESLFCIDELSCTYVRPFLGITQYLSLFTGTFDSIGTDAFLQRQFSISSIKSLLTENWLGLKSAAPYKLNGTGGSYIIHINNSPIAGGTYIYKNHNDQEDEKQINMDFRLASVFKYLTFDFAAGFGAPMGSKNGTEDVILLIDQLYLHTGLDLLIGNKYTNSLFIETGFDNIALKASGKTEIDSDQIFLIVEPRLYTEKFRAHLTIFSIPKDQVEHIELLEENHTFGADLNIFTDRLYFRNKDITFGFHTALSFPERDILDAKRVKELKDDDYIIKIAPYTGIPVMSGMLKIQTQAIVNKFDTGKWYHHVKTYIGFKSNL